METRTISTQRASIAKLRPPASPGARPEAGKGSGGQGDWLAAWSDLPQDKFPLGSHHRTVLKCRTTGPLTPDPFPAALFSVTSGSGRHPASRRRKWTQVSAFDHAAHNRRRIRLPDSAQLQQLSAFDGDSAAAWRLQSALFAELYGALASGLLRRVAADTHDPHPSIVSKGCSVPQQSLGLQLPAVSKWVHGSCFSMVVVCIVLCSPLPW